MSPMAQIVTTAVQADPLSIYSFMAIIVFGCPRALQVVGIHHLTGGKLWFGLCALIYAYVHGAIFFSYAGGSYVSLKPRTKSLDDIVDLIAWVAQHPLT